MGSTIPEWATEPIAIVGVSCRLSGGASNPQKLWELLAEGRSAWTEIPEDRWKAKGLYHPNSAKLGTTHVKGAHFLQEDVGVFDAAFFNYSAEAAAALDPQYRLQLETTYEALENAGLPLSQVAGSNTSVFSGIFQHDYHEGMIRDDANMPRYMGIGTIQAMSANRISHFFDFRGASMTIDTGCSAGLVAFHQGVRSLRDGEADMSVISGCNLMLNPDIFKTFGSVGLLSPDGKSYAFDSRANGYGRGEGVTTFVIKRLRDALAAGDPIRAVIRETGLNQDGKTETITTPSEQAQQDLMRLCYSRAGIDPLGTQYFEAHGTGTPTGDPIECRSIGAVFGGSGRKEPLLIGSIKTNIGHTEAASGLASILKVILSMEHGQIPPSINFEKPNPNLKFDEWGLKVTQDLVPWPTTKPNQPRRASVNNFGYGGSNSHVIVEDADTWLRRLTGTTTKSDRSPPSQSPDTSKVLLLSAKDEQGCQRMVSDLKEYLAQIALANPSPSQVNQLMDSLSYTLTERRTLFPWVSAAPVSYSPESSLDAVIKSLDTPAFKPTKMSGSRPGPRIGMVFTGQGAQWNAMGRELFTSYPVFKATIDEAEEYLNSFGAAWSLTEELHRDAQTSKVNTTAFGQPVCVAVQIALVRLLKSWGITPTAVTSHSSGEIAAAYAVGAMTLRQAMAASYYRAAKAADPAVVRSGERGGMVAVGLGAAEAQEYLDKLSTSTNGGGKAVIACVNSPASVTVAGDVDAVQEMEKVCTEAGVFARRLKVETAFHCHVMAPVAEPYKLALEEELPTLEPKEDEENELEISFSSAVTGGRITNPRRIARPQHWVDSMLQPVQFVEAFTDMVLGDGQDPTGSYVDVVLEVGPHTALGGPIREILSLPEFEKVNLPYFGCLVRKENASNTMRLAAINLLRQGLSVDMREINFPHGMGNQGPPRVLTDLPVYPWNHGIRHWHESRVNKAIRSLEHEPHDLLGSRVPGAIDNKETASWRNFLRTAELPWLRDHCVQGSIVYPAAGYVTLAIEAVKQLAESSDKPVTGFRLRDIDVMAALVIPDDSEGIEVQTSLREVSSQFIGALGWKQFEILSVTSDNRWTTHARGLISPEFTPTSASESAPTLSGYTRHIDTIDLWAGLRSKGIVHGDKFQNISSIIQDGRSPRSLTRITVADTSVPKDLPRSHVLHPTTLDSIIVAAYGALPPTSTYNEEAAKLPRSIQSIWVSANISSSAGQEYTCDTTLGRVDSQSMKADSITILDETSNAPLFSMKGLVCQSLGAGGSADSLDSNEKRKLEKDVASTVKWGADLSLRQPVALEQLKKKLTPSVDRGRDQDQLEIVNNLQRVILYFCQEALKSLPSAKEVAPQYANLYNWIRELVASTSFDTEKISQREITLAADQSVDGELAALLGANLVSILRGEQEVSQVLSSSSEDEALSESLLRRYLSGSIRRQSSFSQIGDLLRVLAHKNPRARVLEVNAGTSGATRHLLKKLLTSEEGGPLVGKWHYTDPSSKYFEDAREKDLAEWSDVVEFDKLDVDKDPETQGFTLGSYDIVVIASGATSKNISSALANVHSLLKPGGTLLLSEPAGVHHQLVDLRFISGLLPAFRTLTETTTPPLSQLLREAGFTGVDVEIPDSQSENLRSRTTILSTVPAPPKTIPSQDILIVTSSSSAPPRYFLSSLKNRLPGSSIATLETSPPETYKNKICLFLGELSQPLLHSLNQGSQSEKTFQAIQSMMIQSRGILWITRGGAVDSPNPEQALAQGFLRVLRNEYVGRRLMLLDLDPRESAAAISSITAVLETGFGESNEAGAVDLEYAERGGVLQIPRIYRDVERNNTIGAPPPASIDWQAADEVLTTEPLLQKGRPLRLKVGVPGLLDTIAFGDDEGEFFGPEFTSEMVDISPRAYGVNFRDVMVAMGQLKERVMGLECGGVITRVGAEAEAKGFKVGDRVMALLLGPFASHARTTWHCVAHIPDDWSFEDAASLPVIYCTVYHGLVDVARMQPGQSILIHAGAGGVGQAAIMLAKHLGVEEIYVTVGSQEKRDLVKSRYGIPDSRIFNSRDTSFGPAVLAATNSRGVDVVLNSLAGPLLQTSFDVLAPLGHFIEIGKRDLESNSLLEMAPFSKATSYAALDLLTLIHHRGTEVSRIFNQVARLVSEGAISPVYPVTPYPISQAAKTFRLLQTGKHTGKVVLSVSAQDQVKVLPRLASNKATLSQQASYLLVGGVGGIGRSIAHWMVDHGARNLVLLSRSAGDVTKTGGFVTELQEAGCRTLALSCDVADPASLTNALRQVAASNFPPIRGVINGAMALQDAILEQMTLADWNASIRPKVSATYNLHTEFSRPDSVDFFVMLSSLSGIIGIASQSNYAAGGTYQDALARFRQSRGLPAVSIDLGAIKNVGYVAENAKVADRLRKQGDMLLLNEDVVLRALESAVLHSLDGTPQILVGVNTGPGPHWEVGGQSQLGRDARYLPLSYRKPRGGAGEGSGASSGGLAAKLAESKSKSEATEIVGDAIRGKLADIFMISVDDIDLAKGPAEYGVDSLVAVELRNLLALQAACEVSIFSILQSVSLAKLAGDVVEKSPFYSAVRLGCVNLIYLDVFPVSFDCLNLASQ
ncbi:hypothetical protein QBC44DRAFT_310175 [Cladorrhinum sp. PSN332]|nr:hypothetical protein QBC44DRAFT_310175 [Cladorrhinum sp. PSN332]